MLALTCISAVLGARLCGTLLCGFVNYWLFVLKLWFCCLLVVPFVFVFCYYELVVMSVCVLVLVSALVLVRIFF